MDVLICVSCFIFFITGVFNTMNYKFKEFISHKISVLSILYIIFLITVEICCNPMVISETTHKSDKFQNITFNKVMNITEIKKRRILNLLLSNVSYRIQ